MHIIPVVDIRGGIAVRAARGDRANYGPMASPLASSPDPVAVAAGLRSLFPFRTLYVADLDAIEGRGRDTATQMRLLASWPGSELWVDDGRRGGGQPESGAPSSSCRRCTVIGSECLSDPRHAAAGDILSLDFQGDTFLGPRELLETPALWPGRIIVMTLKRVGSGEGPDLERLQWAIANAGGKSVYAAGGIRHAKDLKALRELGVAGALIASALHDGQIKTGDLEEIAG